MQDTTTLAPWEDVVSHFAGNGEPGDVLFQNQGASSLFSEEGARSLTFGDLVPANQADEPAEAGGSLVFEGWSGNSQKVFSFPKADVSHLLGDLEIVGVA